MFPREVEVHPVDELMPRVSQGGGGLESPASSRAPSLLNGLPSWP